jgi:hypothetical protein
MDEHTTVGEYLIPRRIPRGFQFRPGVGVKEAAFGTAGAALAFLLWWGLGQAGLPLIYRGFIGMLPLLVGVGLALPMEDSHGWEWLRDFLAFRQKPKTLTFDWTAGDW